MQFNYWPDNFYHSSADRIVHVDPTELKRVGFTAAAAFYYLSDGRALPRPARPGLGSGRQRREMDRRSRPPERPPPRKRPGQDPRPAQGRPDQGRRRVRPGEGRRRVRPDPGPSARSRSLREASRGGPARASPRHRLQAGRGRLSRTLRRLESEARGHHPDRQGAGIRPAHPAAEIQGLFRGSPEAEPRPARAARRPAPEGSLRPAPAGTAGRPSQVSRRRSRGQAPQRGPARPARRPPPAGRHRRLLGFTSHLGELFHRRDAQHPRHL